MKFDVFRDSDYQEGRVGSDVCSPLEDAVFNPEENRWELEVKDLEDLLNKVKATGCAAIILPGCGGCGSLPVLSIADTECDEDAPESGPHAVN